MNSNITITNDQAKCGCENTFARSIFQALWTEVKITLKNSKLIDLSLSVKAPQADNCCVQDQ